MKTLREALQAQELALTAELALTPRLSAAGIVAQARLLGGMADAIHVPDHRHAIPHISNMTAASHLLHAGIDPIVHMSCRDRNRIALQSDLLAARSLGVSNLLLMRGTALPVDHRPPATSVFDHGALDLIRTAAGMRDGSVFAAEPGPDAREFYIGTIATVFEPGKYWQPEVLTEKADAGAQFVQLQLCLDIEVLREYMAHLVAAKLTWRFQVLAALAVLPSATEARLLCQQFPDSIIPAGVIERLEQSGNPEQEGIEMCAEMLRALVDVPGIAGASLMTPGDPASIGKAVSLAGVRPDLG